MFILADGLGGHGNGDLASKIVTETSAEVFQHADCGMEELLRQCFETAQNNLLEAKQANESAKEMRTTLVLLHVSGGRAIWGHIGDSRLYFFRNNKLVLRTLDHSVPQWLVSIGDIKEKAIRHHEDRNKLLKVMGEEWNKTSYQISEETIELKSGDRFLLCSDGFWEWIDERSMAKHLRAAQHPALWLRLMEKEILHNGANANMDNYSAIAVYVE